MRPVINQQNETHSIQVNERFQFYWMKRFIYRHRLSVIVFFAFKKHHLYDSTKMKTKPATTAKSNRSSSSGGNGITIKYAKIQQEARWKFVPLDFTPYGFITQAVVEERFVYYFFFALFMYFVAQAKVWKQILTVNLDTIWWAYIYICCSECKYDERHWSNTYLKFVKQIMYFQVDLLWYTLVNIWIDFIALLASGYTHFPIARCIKMRGVNSMVLKRVQYRVCQWTRKKLSAQQQHLSNVYISHTHKINQNQTRTKDEMLFIILWFNIHA